MHIPIERNSGIPIYIQIANWIRINIRLGNLPSGMRLPSTRSLADELNTSRITVKNAYSMLASEGLLISHEGSGTYIAPPVVDVNVQEHTQIIYPAWQIALTAQYSTTHSQHFQPFARQDTIISFTGVADKRLFPLNEFSKCLQQVLRRDGAAALDYGNLLLGYEPLRHTIAQILASQGIQSSPQNILITSGSQQGLVLTCQVLLKPGDCILVEKPTYNFALELFQSMGLKIIAVTLDKDGIQTENLETLIQQHHPKLIYTIPNFQNPSGTCLTAHRRRQLLALADRFDLPVLEDDYAGDLRYEGQSQPAIKALDPGGRVIYTGTFSKMVMPGLRVGYLAAEGPVFERLVRQKRVTDLSTSGLMQRALNNYVTIGRYQSHLKHSTRLYRARRDALIQAIHTYLPHSVRVMPVHGGLFLWLTLPDRISARKLLSVAIEEGVEYTPGDLFFACPEDGYSNIRFNFAVHSPIEIEKGIKRLAKAMKRYTIGDNNSVTV